MDDKAHYRDGAQKSSPKERGSLRVWVSLAIVFLILFAVGLGQWDWAVAGAIGLVVGNGLQALVFGG